MFEDIGLMDKDKLTEIFASRAEPAKDFIDEYILCRDLNIETKEKLFKIVSSYIPMSILAERQMNFIKYLGEDLGYDWK